MAMFGWFDTREADTFAAAVAEDLIGRLPPDAVQQGKIAPERARNAHEAIMARAGAFARTHKLNWYTKAHFGNTVRWTLQERGYDKEFVDTWTHNLLVALTGAKGARL